MSTVSSWGRLTAPGEEILSEDLEHITHDVTLSRGLGRSYGDASLPPPGRLRVAGSRLADRLLAFDSTSGLLRAEAGCSLRQLNLLFLPRGWVSPVLPGTQYVTLGGMVAADVHGKNHHCEGTFGRHVRRLRLRVADGRILWCSREEEPELFAATLGGMGLTGHILEVEVGLRRIPSPWIYGESERIPDLDRFLEGLREAAHGWPFTVGWIDCLTRGRHMGRGILYRGRWARADEAPRSPPQPKRRLEVPFELPGGLLNRFTVGLFNFLYYWKHQPRHRRRIIHPESFFYPLDILGSWNRIYGRRGFTQYQCVLPAASGAEGVRRFLDLLTRMRSASFLCVIKDCGEEGEGLLSFPLAGITVAVDLPITDSTQALVDRLNERVIAEGGRVYLAKDGFTRAEHFQEMEPRLATWRRIRKAWDPEGRLRSAQSVRVLGDS